MAKRAPLDIHLDQTSTEARYVRDVNGKWEYGICWRKNGKMVYKKAGAKVTMHEAEAANDIGQPQPRNNTSLNVVPVGQFYGAKRLVDVPQEPERDEE